MKRLIKFLSIISMVSFGSLAFNSTSAVHPTKCHKPQHDPEPLHNPEPQHETQQRQERATSIIVNLICKKILQIDIPTNMKQILRKYIREYIKQMLPPPSLLIAPVLQHYIDDLTETLLKKFKEKYVPFLINCNLHPLARNILQNMSEDENFNIEDLINGHYLFIDQHIRDALELYLDNYCSTHNFDVIQSYCDALIQEVDIQDKIKAIFAKL